MHNEAEQNKTKQKRNVRMMKDDETKNEFNERRFFLLFFASVLHDICTNIIPNKEVT